MFLSLIQSPAAFQYYGPYLERSDTRKAIHVGNLTYNSGEKVEQHLENDMMQSVKPWLAEVMNNYRVSDINVTVKPVSKDLFQP